jgi:preprotein translocase subunit Sss1
MLYALEDLASRRQKQRHLIAKKPSKDRYLKIVKTS